MFNWFNKEKPQADTPSPKKKKSLFSTHDYDEMNHFKVQSTIHDKISEIYRQQPALLHSDGAMDNSDNGFPAFKSYAGNQANISDQLMYWYANQGFIGAQL